MISTRLSVVQTQQKRDLAPPGLALRLPLLVPQLVLMADVPPQVAPVLQAVKACLVLRCLLSPVALVQEVEVRQEGPVHLGLHEWPAVGRVPTVVDCALADDCAEHNGIEGARGHDAGSHVHEAPTVHMCIVAAHQHRSEIRRAWQSAAASAP